jgi:hypothetical protein
MFGNLTFGNTMFANSTGLPQALPWKKSRRGQRSILKGGFCWRCGYPLCGGCEGAAGSGHAKTSLQGSRKTVTGRILGYSCSDEEETSGPENKTCLEAAGPPGREAAGVAIAPGPDSLTLHPGLPGLVSTAVHA